MNQPIRQIQPPRLTQGKQARGEKGFSQIILLGVIAVIILTGVGGFLLLKEKKTSSFDKTENAANPIEPTRSPAQSVQTQKPKTQLVSPSTPKASIKEDKPPVLKNLGIVLDVPNIQTKRAGDMIFDKIVVWEDGGSYSNKAFGEFGEMGKRKDILNLPGVEYNFAAPVGTKVYAAGDGIARVFYIEHTQDWGINIQPKVGSKWNIGHEHIVNLIVKDRGFVKVGDILGEATPNRMGYATTQLAVWTGGKDGIVKYCPFNFLDDSLKPVYEEKLNRLAKDWEEFIGKDVYEQEKWVAPGCLMDKIIER